MTSKKTKKKPFLWSTWVDPYMETALNSLKQILYEEGEIKKGPKDKVSRSQVIDYMIERFLDTYYDEILNNQQQESKENIELDEIRIKQMQQLQNTQKERLEEKDNKIVEINTKYRTLQDKVDKQGKKLEEIKVG